MKHLIHIDNPENFARLMSYITYSSILIVGILFFNAVISFEAAVIVLLCSILLFQYVAVSFNMRVQFDVFNAVSEVINNGTSSIIPKGSKVREIHIDDPADLDAALKSIQEEIMKDIASHEESIKKEEKD